MGDFSVIGVDHVNVGAPNELMDETIGWYRDCLGLDEIDKPEGTHDAGGWFRVGDQELHVSLDEHNPPKQAHFGLVVDDFDAVVEDLRTAGCHIEQAAVIPGRHRCYTRDPAGNRIEIMAFDAAAGA
ncbi:MAG: VOC family protein [Actinomycetota bacterium]|nr:VOC family protein [Actinomycetota bacterium]